MNSLAGFVIEVDAAGGPASGENDPFTAPVVEGDSIFWFMWVTRCQTTVDVSKQFLDIINQKSVSIVNTIKFYRNY